MREVWSQSFNVQIITLLKATCSVSKGNFLSIDVIQRQSAREIVRRLLQLSIQHSEVSLESKLVYKRVQHYDHLTIPVALHQQNGELGSCP